MKIDRSGELSNGVKYVIYGPVEGADCWIVGIDYLINTNDIDGILSTIDIWEKKKVRNKKPGKWRHLKMLVEAKKEFDKIDVIQTYLDCGGTL